MADIGTALAEGLRALSAWEAVAVALAVTYLLLIIRQNPLGWPAAIASAGIYTVLMFQAGLVMQSLLQVFYIAMAGYGWWRWARPGYDQALPVVRWPLRAHVVPAGLIFALGLGTGWWLEARGASALPYGDALTAWGAIVATWLVARKVLQNWHYWFVIDAVSIYLYAHQGLWLTAMLFAAYLVLIVLGYRRWRASLEAGHA